MERAQLLVLAGRHETGAHSAGEGRSVDGVVWFVGARSEWSAMCRRPRAKTIWKAEARYDTYCTYCMCREVQYVVP